MRKQGFTIIEVLVVLVIFLTLMGIGYVSVVGIERRAPISATVTTVIAELRGAQTQAMVGAGTTTYNLAGVTLPDNITLTTTFPGSAVTFLGGSGDISGYTATQNTITIIQTLTGEHTTITLNRYGAVTQMQ